MSTLGETRKFPAMGTSTAPAESADTAKHAEISSEGQSIAAKPKRHRRLKFSRGLTVLKTLSWRLTGVYVWWSVLRSFLSGLGVRESTVNLTDRIAAYLSSVGFEPINSAHLSTIVATGWWMVLTAFRPIEMAVFTAYLVFFPLLPLFVYLTHGIAAENKPDGREFGLAPRSRRLALPVCGLMLLGWLILFGDTSFKRPATVGAALSGFLFLLLALRAFRRVRPSPDPDPNFLRVPKLLGLMFLRMAHESLKSGKPTKNQAIVWQRFYRLVEFCYLPLATWTRGVRGKNRIYLFVLGEYVFSLVLLASSAVLFWAMADKAVMAPTNLPLSFFLSLTATSIFPALPHVASVPNLPTVMLVGPSISGWILFVVYVGPASSLLGHRQMGYAKSVATSHRLFRSFTVAFGKYVYYFGQLAKKEAS